MQSTAAKTLLDKCWDAHVVAALDGGFQLLHVDRHLLHDLSGPLPLMQLQERKLPVNEPSLVFATPDHCVSTLPGRTIKSTKIGAMLIPELQKQSLKRGITLFDMASADQGIVHVIGPELGLTLPGLTVVCGDSHTSTHGALGALAWGIGTSEITHALATGCLLDEKPKSLRIRIDGEIGRGVTAKDVALFLLGRFTASVGVGYAIEFAGAVVEAFSIEERMTLCNLAIEMGARIGQVAPDEKTFAYLKGRRYAPQGAAWDAAVAHWRTLPSDAEARFDRELAVDAAEIAPQITWGSSPDLVIPVTAPVPVLGSDADPVARESWQAALDYMGLVPGQPMVGLKVDHVFIGSCTNSRLSDLRAAAGIVRGRKVAEGTTAWVVPGSQRVKREAEAEGLHTVFIEAGFEWRESGCSMCLATNGETVAPKARCVSTSNRNFVGRQGPDARTHLASPAMAAAAAVSGCIVDVRKLNG